MKRLPAVLFALFVTGTLAEVLRAAELINDRAIMVHTAREATEKRRALIQYLWGDAGFPTSSIPDIILSNIATPVKELTNLARVDEFRIDLAPGLQGLAYHFIPQQANRELVVVHHGHGCTLDDEPGPADAGFGLQRTIRAMLREGYGVLG